MFPEDPFGFFNTAGSGSWLNGNVCGEWIYHILLPQPDHTVIFLILRDESPFLFHSLLLLITVVVSVVDPSPILNM